MNYLPFGISVNIIFVQLMLLFWANKSLRCLELDEIVRIGNILKTVIQFSDSKLFIDGLEAI